MEAFYALLHNKGTKRFFKALNTSFEALRWLISSTANPAGIGFSLIEAVGFRFAHMGLHPIPAKTEEEVTCRALWRTMPPGQMD